MKAFRTSKVLFPIGAVAAAAVLMSACGSYSAPSTPSYFLTSLGAVTQISSTVPPNGDINPYGVAVIPTTTGRLIQGETLVSNFNASINVQGTGTTLVEVAPNKALTVFATIHTLPAGMHCPGGIGLGTALGILPGGFVVVGSIPAAGPSGVPANFNPNGCLIVLNSSGQVVETWTNSAINGPWDMTISVSGNHAAIFVANALSRTNSIHNLPPTGMCTVSRIDVNLGSGIPQLVSTTVIGRSFPWQINNPTFVLSPTGLALASDGTLYVVQTLGNHITSIPNALTRSDAVTDGTSTITSGGSLNAPLGLTIVANGDLIAVNGNDGNAVEITPSGTQVATLTLVKDGAGALFGVVPTSDGKGLVFVNDSANALDTVTTK